MSEIEVAEPMTPLNLKYNMQASNPSAYQKRITSYLYPTQNGVITSNGTRTIRFLVGSNFFLDGRNSYLRLQAKIDGGLGTGATNVNTVDTSGTAVTPYNRAVFSSYTETWIKSITLYTNMGVVIEQIRDYNILGAIMKANIENEYGGTVGFESLNIVDSASNSLSTEMRQVMSSQFKTYVIEMRGSGFLKAFNYLPLRALAGQNSNSFQIEIEFAPLNEMVIAWQQIGVNPAVPTNYSLSLAGATNPTANSGTGLGYTLQNIVLVQSLLQDDLMEASLMDTIKSVPLMLHFDTYRHYSNGIPGNQSGATTLSISEYQESVKSMTSVSRYTSAIGLQTVDSTSFIFPNLTQYQLQIGPVYYPSQPILLSGGTNGIIPDLGEQYYEYVKENQKAMFYSKGFSPSVVKDNDLTYLGTLYPYQSQKSSDQFVLTNDLRPFPDYALGDPDFTEFISGYNTKSSPQPLQLLLQNTTQDTLPIPGNPNNNVTVDSFTNYDAYCVIQSNEVYIIS